MKKVAVVSFIILLIDQFFKYIVQAFLMPSGTITIIPSFFQLVYAENNGAAWSLFSGSRLFLILVTFVFLIMIYYFLLKDENISKLERLGVSFLIGGILGNLCDRIFLGYVVDYLSFNIFGYQYPVFNFADICIVLSIIFLIVITCREVLPWKLKSKKKKS